MQDIVTEYPSTHAFVPHLRQFIEFRKRTVALIDGYTAEETAFDLTQCQKNGSIVDVALAVILNEQSGRKTTVTDLQFQIGVGKTTVVRALDKLEKMGVAKRAKDEGDRRRTIVTLCPRFASKVISIILDICATEQIAPG